MSDRPTPEQIALQCAVLYKPQYVADETLRRFAEHGYVIVHPDDVPYSVTGNTAESVSAVTYDEGWNDCRDFIFGGDR